MAQRYISKNHVATIVWTSLYIDYQHQCFNVTNGLFPLPESDSDPDSETNSCIMQDFSIGSDLDSDPLIEMYVIGMEICPWDRDPTLKWVQ